MRVLRLAVAFAAGCGAKQGGPVEPPPPPLETPDAAPPQVLETPPARPEGLYSVGEAVADVFSGPWRHIGSGPWHGIHRISACAYRNERVLVVNVYCTAKEMRAFRIDVFSPARGRVRIYAEGRAPVSTLTRAQYFTFKAETEPPPPPEAGLPPVSLAMSFAELQDYERRRYEKFMPACYGGTEIEKRQGGCLGELEPKVPEWEAANRPFLDDPPPDWYRLVREMRALAPRHADRQTR